MGGDLVGSGQGLFVPHDARSVRVVRAEVARDLVAAGASESAVDDAALVVSELVGNAVRHGRALPGGVLCARWGVTAGALHLEVEDGGTGPAGGAVAAAPDAAESGRGLGLVELLATRWGTAATASGTAVWAELPTAAARRGTRA